MTPWDAQVMQQEEGKPEGPLTPTELRKRVPFEADATSDRLGWVGLDAGRYRLETIPELYAPGLTHHTLVLVTRPPERLELLYEGVRRYGPPTSGAISVVPAGIPVCWRWCGRKDSLHIHLEPEVIARVAAETFDIDPAQLTVPSLDCLDLPHLRAAMLAVDAELTAGEAGGALVAESLANVLAVHLIRHVLAPCRMERGPDGALPRRRLRAVLECIEDQLDVSPTLEQMAAVAHLSPYHFARQFKAATGLPPHQYVIIRRVERAKALLQGGTGLSLAAVAARAGFADQSHLCRQFKQLVGVTPGQFQNPAKTDQQAARPFKKRPGVKLYHTP